MTEPVTEAGRLTMADPPADTSELLGAILAIEAEARLALLSDPEFERVLAEHEHSFCVMRTTQHGWDAHQHDAAVTLAFLRQRLGQP